MTDKKKIILLCSEVKLQEADKYYNDYLLSTIMICRAVSANVNVEFELEKNLVFESVNWILNFASCIMSRENLKKKLVFESVNWYVVKCKF